LLRHDEIAHEVDQHDGALRLPPHVTQHPLESLSALAHNSSPLVQKPCFRGALEVAERQLGQVVPQVSLPVLFDHQSEVKGDYVVIDQGLHALHAPFKACVHSTHLFKGAESLRGQHIFVLLDGLHEASE